MESPQRLSSSDEKSFESLLNSTFPVPVGRSFFDDFPIWKDWNHPQLEVFGVLLDGRVASSAACRIGRLKAPQGELKVGMIGAVATLPEVRGQGWASDCVAWASQRLEKKGVDLILLWGGEHAFYERLGFHLRGVQGRALLSSVQVSHERTTEYEEEDLLDGWKDGIFEVLKTRSFGVVLEEGDRNWVAAHQNVHWYSVERNGQILAYAALGRGMDLQGIVHEWGGCPHGLRRLLAVVLRDFPEAQIIGPPSLLEAVLEVPSDQIIRENLALVKELNSSLIEQVGGMDSLWVWGLDAV